MVPCSCPVISSTWAAVRGSISSSTAWSSKASCWRLARGLYDYPKSHLQLGLLSPSVDAIAEALAGRDRLRIQPSGAYAANLLHLSEQVPAKAVFLTDGHSRRLKVGCKKSFLSEPRRVRWRRRDA